MSSDKRCLMPLPGLGEVERNEDHHDPGSNPRSISNLDRPLVFTKTKGYSYAVVKTNPTKNIFLLV